MIPELEAMLVLLFDKDEVQSLQNMRKEYEYKILRATKREDDFVKYINFETQFLRMLKLRYKKKGIQKNAKLSNIEYAIGRRLHRLFVLAIRSFPRDLRLWMAYVKFCQKMRFSSAASRVLEQMLDEHGHSKPELYKLAAKIELDDCNDIDKARKYLLMGIHVHKDNKSLLTEAFRLELTDAERKRKELEEKNVPIDPTNIHLSAKKAENIYDSAIKKLNDVELMNDLMSICAQYDFASALQNKISNDLFEHDTNERMWDIIATRELNHSDGKLSSKAKIQKCVALYETATKRLNTGKMWAYYLDALIEIGKDTSVLPNYKRKLLLTALQKAANAGRLTEKYYLLWVSLLQGPEKHKKLVEVLQGAVKKLPDSVTLWHTLLRVHLTKGEEKQANQVFDQGVAVLTKQSLPLWKLMLQFEQTKRINKVEELFKKSWNHCNEISAPLKPMYLEWLVLTQGIAVARKVYANMCEMPSPCVEMHKKMVYLESIQPTMNMKRIRQCYTIACSQFGDLDVDVWMDHCKFEINNGDPERVSEIYWRARKDMSPQQFETFLSELTIVSAQSLNGLKDGPLTTGAPPTSSPHNVRLGAATLLKDSATSSNNRATGRPTGATNAGADAATCSRTTMNSDGASGTSENKEPSHEKPTSTQENDEDDGTVELVRRYLAEKLRFYKEDKETNEIPKVLDDVSVDGIVKLIKEGKCKNIVTMAGAGISTSAGIPDFRSPGSGLYHNLQQYKLPYPQAIFEIGFFRQNPQPFFTLAKELYPGSFKPTVCHYFIRLLQEKGVLLRHYTQNIDTLERVAGLPGDKIIEAHGTFYTSHCLKCEKEYSMEWMKEIIFQDNIPTCTSCNGVVKPDIVFFGENLPDSFYKNFPKDFPNADLLIIMGSSLAVQPFESLVDRVKKDCPRLLINREKVGGPDRLMQMLGMGGGLDFDSASNIRDVAWLGDCDQGCQLLADKLGWGDELREIVKTEHKKIDEEKAKEKNAEKTLQNQNTSGEKEIKDVQNEKSSPPTT